jgi:DNA-binding response OmpR family regulator
MTNTQKSTSAHIGAAPQERTRRILIADDDEPTRRMLAEWLEQEGYQIWVAADGEQALEAAPRFLPDLILLDVTMPKIDGLEVARRVRAEGNARSRLRILMVSGLDDDLDRVAGLRAGADDYVTKPVRPRELLLRIQALL